MRYNYLVSHPYTHIINEIGAGGPLVIEPFRGKQALYGMGVVSGQKYWFIPCKDWWNEFLDDLRKTRVPWIVFDMRRVMDFGIERIEIIDIKTLCGGGETSLLSRMKELTPTSYLIERLADLESRNAANYRAMKTAQVDPVGRLPETMTPQFFEDYLKTRALAIRDLYTKRFENKPAMNDWWRRLDFVKTLHEIELNGIRIDKDFVDSQLLKQNDPATTKTFRSMQSLYKNGYVTALFNAHGTKTGRLRPEGGFGAMGVPHGPARKAIVSRHEGGKIYSFDYNAIDYRSIVSSIGGDFAALYVDSRDFHTRTAQFIFKEVDEVRRDALKAISYTSIYGGSVETLVSRTGLKKEIIEEVLKRLKPNLEPISQFRENLWGLYQTRGYIDIPGVGRYEKNGEEMHPGKLLALYAQGYSAYVFEMAMTQVNRFLKENGHGTCVIFPVHDELVLDVHPDDEKLMDDVKRIMETGVAQGFVVNYKKGGSYGEVE